MVTGVYFNGTDSRFRSSWSLVSSCSRSYSKENPFATAPNLIPFHILIPELSTINEEMDLMDNDLPIDFEALGNIKDFVSTLKKRGFIVQKGELRYIDILKACSEGKVDSCMANNAVAPYAVGILPPAPGQDPGEGQDPSPGYDPDNPDNYPPNINFILPGLTYKLRSDEAIVVLGKTPPPAVYFSFRSYLGYVENKPGKDYSKYSVTGNDETGIYHRIFAALGDTVSNFNIWTENTPGGAAGNPSNSSSILITTADRDINEQIRDALESAGYSPDIMNNDNIPLGLVNMGLEKGKDTFIYLMRVAIWAEKHVGDAYINNLDTFVQVLRITPKIALASINPWPVPDLKIKETGTTEFQIVPAVRDDLDHLRSEIINKYGTEEYDHVELNTNLWLPKSYEGLIQDVDVLGDTLDAAYLKTDEFQLKSDDDFVIVYGVNHEVTGKAIYNNVCFYGVKFLNGVAVANVSIEFQNSAAEYFPEEAENSKYYYVCKMARRLGDDCLITIPYSTGNPSGIAFGVDNNQDVFVGFRSYSDKETGVGPALFDYIWDRAILFKKKAKANVQEKGKTNSQKKETKYQNSIKDQK